MKRTPKIIRLVNKKPLSFKKKIFIWPINDRFLPQDETTAFEYLRIPAMPVKSLNIFLIKLDLEVGKARVRPMSGSLSVSVYL